jgi:thiamine biosynthesis lipoprotein
VPHDDRRGAHSVPESIDSAVATSGGYRHWIEVAGNRLAHTMNPELGGPLIAPPGSVTVLAPTCMDADAWATALMVLGRATGVPLAQARGLEGLFLDRDGPENLTATWAAG